MEFRVLVADQGKAQLFELPSRRSALKSLQCFINPASQRPERALGSGPPGRGTSSVGRGRHAYQPKHGIKEHAEEVFVRQVGSALATDVKVTNGVPLVLIAAPRLLGLYRRHLPTAVRNRIAVEIKLDLVKLPVTELGKRVRAAVTALPMSVTARFPAPRRRPAV